MSKQRIPATLPTQYRAAKIDAKAAGDGKRLSGEDPGRFSFALTSEEPVRRWFGNEILKHGKDNIRTDRLDAGQVPLLFNHDPDQHLGRVDGYSIKDGMLRVEGMFGNSPLAQQKRQDYDDGVLVSASAGYRIHKVVRTEDEDNPNAPDQVDVTDWEPFDASFVTVPADSTVGVGRSEGEAEAPVHIETVTRRSATSAPPAPAVEVVNQPQQENRTMAEEVKTPSPAELELKRRDEIMAVAGDKDFGKHVTPEEVRSALANKDLSADAFKDTVIRKIIEANEAGKVGTVGDRTFGSASGKDQRSYSLTSLIRSLVNQTSPGTFKGKHEAGFEREMSDALWGELKDVGLDRRGLLVPLSALTRALGTQTIGSGSGQLGITSEAAAVATITRPDVIELLRHRPRTQALGARVLGGLQGIVRLPRQSGAGTWQWLGEGAAVTPADLAMDFVSVQPRRGSTQSAIDIELLASTSPDVEALMRADFNKIRSLAIDYAAINGPTGGPGPVGLLNASGLATITPSGTTLGSGGNALAYADYVAFETACAVADADVATSGWMLTPEVRGQAKTTPKFTNTGGALIAEPIWKEGPKDPDGLEEGPLGYKAGVTNQLPKNLTHSGVTGSVLHAGIFGDWAQLILADWGVVEVIYDPYTQAGSGAIVLTMRSLHDVAVRHIAAFAASLRIAVS